MDQKVKKCCPGCSQVFALPSVKQPKNRLPLLLPCGHSTCQSCLKNMIKFSEPIECKVCHKESEWTSGDIQIFMKKSNHLYTKYPIDTCTWGHMTLPQNENKTDIPETKDYYIDLKGILNSVDNVVGTCVECQASTSKMCQQCSSVLCQACFDEIHKKFQSFKGHNYVKLEVSLQPNFCSIHPQKTLDYYCTDCSKAVCMDCMMVGGEKSCKSHTVVSIQEKNVLLSEELHTLVPVLEETLRRASSSAVDLGNMLKGLDDGKASNSELQKTIIDIQNHFSKLHALLQKRETETVDVLQNLKHAKRDLMMKAKSELSGNITSIRKVLNQIKAVGNTENPSKTNLSGLLESAKQAADSTWYIPKVEDCTKNLKVTLNDDLAEMVSQCVQLEGDLETSFKLLATKDIEKDVTLPPAPTKLVYPPELPRDVREVTNQKSVNQSNVHTIPMFRPRFGSNSSINSSGTESSTKNMFSTPNEESSQGGHVRSFKEGRQQTYVKYLVEGAQELIFICHIANPHNFYVQRSCQQSLVKDLMKEFRKANTFKKPAVINVTEGKLFLAYSKADNQWHRCRIVSVDTGAKRGPLYQVFSLDFGMTDYVDIENLRMLPTARLHNPAPLAIHCSLANVQPVSGAWTQDDALLMQKIIDNKQAVIYVRQVRGTPASGHVTLDCDVTTFEDGVSLAHALVFHERATLYNPKLPYPRINALEERPRIFFGHNDFKDKAKEEVYITHIVNPDKFYVRKCYLQDAYLKLCEDMEQTYSMRVQSGAIHCPTIGMVCAANVGAEGMAGGGWRRGIVRELPGRLRARVHLPDTGETLLLHISALRHIQHKFTTINALAVECHLDGVTPPYNKKWSAGAVSLLASFQGPVLELHVEKTQQRSRGSLGVVLYANTDDERVCVNSELIKNRFAITFGIYKFQDPQLEESQQVYTNKVPIDGKGSRKTTAKQTKSKVTILQKKPETQAAPPTQVDEEDLDALDKGPLKIEIKVLSCQTPSLIYVTLLDQQKKFSELYDDLQEFYFNSKPPNNKEWKVGDRCCGNCKQTRTWRRAIIMELMVNHAKLFYIDFAVVETIPLTDLRELDPKHGTIHNAAVKCHLHGIHPASGEEWPSLTKEYLLELVDAYPRIFLTNTGTVVNNSVPIELWVYHITPGDALEANKAEWRCINYKIVEQGLALPDPSYKEKIKTDGGDVNASLLNIFGSVQEWLQLEPQPEYSPDTTKLDDDGQLTLSPQSPEAATRPETEETTVSTGVNTLKMNLGPAMNISDWLPAEPLPVKEFTAMPTYIDDDGIVYLHDIVQSDTVELVQKSLERFKLNEPKVIYKNWTVGEPCIAQFYLDNRFYRGRVVTVNPDAASCIIHYIDYGNIEVCAFKNIRKSIVLYQIPVQAHKCVLAHIKPKAGRWLRNTLDYIHQIIVEKKCLVKVVGEKIGDVVPIELKINKLWLHEHLVDFDEAVYADGSVPAQPKFVPHITDVTKESIHNLSIESDPDYIVEEVSSDKLNDSMNSYDSREVNKNWIELMDEEDHNFVTYTYRNIPEDSFNCTIAALNNLNCLDLILEQDEITSKLYKTLSQDLQASGATMPKLKGVFKDKACISLFPEDNEWYRSLIMEYCESRDLVKVKYVDFGNIETLPIANVREIDPDWLKLPPATIPAKLAGYTVAPDANLSTVASDLEQAFIDVPLRAQIVKREDLIQVELRTEDNELCYKNLIQSGVLIKT